MTTDYPKINFRVFPEEMNRLRKLNINDNYTNHLTNSVHTFCRKTLFEVLGINRHGTDTAAPMGRQSGASVV